MNKKIYKLFINRELCSDICFKLYSISLLAKHKAPIRLCSGAECLEAFEPSVNGTAVRVEHCQLDPLICLVPVGG